MVMTGSSTVEEGPPQHQVFINFRGVELRYGFVSHLVNALQTNYINVFIDNHEDRGEPIEILLDRIEQSRIAVVIFSGRYTESIWCLREAAKIKDCMDKGILKVIPIFYKVEPSTVRYLQGDFGDEFRKKAEGDERKKKWKKALKAIADLMGTIVDEKSNESDIVKKTVDDVKKVLIKIPSEGSQIVSVDLSPSSDTRTSSGEKEHMTFGNELRLKELEEKLDPTQKKKTRIIGVVGMPGIGKTTLLKELTKTWKGKFSRHALIDQIREKSNYSEEFDILPKLVVQELLAFNESTLENVEDPYEMYKSPLLQCKVLVILDDVSKSEQIDALLGRLDWICEGSRIIIATNDMSLLKDRVTDTYVVPQLNHQDGLKLLHYHAFGEANPPEDFMQLSNDFVHFTRGHPLALKILGQELNRNEKPQWEEQRIKLLAESPIPYIGSVFRLSYNELSSDQQKAFLDIACFRSHDVDYVESLLASSESISAVKALTDKCLINTCDGRVEMHDLLYTFSRELDSKESTNDYSTGRRLWRHQDIIKGGKMNVVQNNMRAANVRGIFLDLSEVKGEICLDHGHFKNMRNLRYLKFYNSHCPQECKTDNKINIPDGLILPLKEVRCLHWLKFPLDELPTDFNPINLVDLKLPYSEITQLWEGDKNTPVLKWVDLNHSSKLSTLSGLSKAPNLQGLNLEGCTSLESLGDVDSKSLKTLTLSGCSTFKEFPLIPENLETLHLDGTAISEVPDNIVNHEKLVLLNMKDCELLENIPNCVGELKVLQKLVLSGCKKLQKFPEVKKSSLKILLLDVTSITTMPQLLSVQYLCLSFNDHLSCLPADINQLSQLTRLDLKYCKSLTSVPELPPNLQYFDVDGCSSLKTVAKPVARIIPTVQNHGNFNFTNCGNLEQVAKEEIASYAHRKCQLLSDARKQYIEGLSSDALFSTCFPGCEVPSWFSHDGVGSRLELKLLPHWHDKSLSGIALCAVVSFPGVQDRISGFSVACSFTIKATEESSIPFTFPVGSWTKEGDTIQSSHVFIAYISCPHTIKCLEDENSDVCKFTEASIEFTVTGGTSEIGKVLRCGLSLVYEKNINKNSSHDATYDMPVEVSFQDSHYGVVIDDQRISEKSKELIPSSITQNCGTILTPRMGNLHANG